MRLRIAPTPVIAVLLACALSAALPSGFASAGAPKTDAPAGDYAIDKAHASLVFRIDHMGFSFFTTRFTQFDATLHFDPAKPEAMSVSATIDPKSIEIYGSRLGEILQADEWFNSAKFPEITFKSARIDAVKDNTAVVTGDLTLRGVTRPVMLQATFNGGYASMAMDPSGSRIGFSAKGVLKRSDFGMSYGIPAPGTTMGVGDAVEFQIEAEFTRPKQN